MKREIKFRGKRLDNGEWVIGLLVKMWVGWHIIDWDDENTAYPVHPDTIGQFTGLKDKNGRDIYEGDIIECADSRGEPIRHFVEFCKERGYYAQYLAGHSPLPAYEAGPIYQDYIDKLGKYVVGNVFDNPELLKTE